MTCFSSQNNFPHFRVKRIMGEAGSGLLLTLEPEGFLGTREAAQSCP